MAQHGQVNVGDIKVRAGHGVYPPEPFSKDLSAEARVLLERPLQWTFGAELLHQDVEVHIVTRLSAAMNG